jgi:nitrate reductase NapD
MIVCGVLVRAHPDDVPTVRERLARLEGVEIHAATDDGRLVVTVEGTDPEAVGNVVLETHRLPGVLAASLVYHHFEPDDAAREDKHEAVTA